MLDPHKRLPRAALGFALVLGACAIPANTPQQNLAYPRWARCRASFAQLQGVDLDGRVTFQFTNGSERNAILQCLADAGRSGPSLPAPTGVPLPGGS